MSDDTIRPVPQPGILDIAPYLPGKSGAPGSNAVKLSANESPLGASPRAMEAFRAAADHLDIYPEGSSRLLRTALGEVHGIDPELIVCGNGSDDLLHLLAQCYLGEGDEAVMSRYGFSVYPIITRAKGAAIVMVDEDDYTADVDALLAAVTPKTKVVWLANPNNPTGTYLPDAEIRRLHAGLRPDILLVIDNAYAEYVTAEDFTVATALVREAQNVVMVRTFSKMGLAAARIGWMFGPAPIVDAINRIRGPFNVSLPAQLAGAAAARDVEFTARLKAHNAQWRDWITAELNQSNHFRVVPSQANFVMVMFPDADHAALAFQTLLGRGLIVREIGASYGIPDGLRISIGSEQAMRGVVGILKALVKIA
ncbi:MAG: histidinol-phosphate transaminase [Alphaproteobacteria bacterium]|nr:histidinol-phosphate transaminase [Alphaproteobacteria bacterium]MBU1561313.1 histidinol-phosphate transaminase [Alphaproteobacteria bacterium]MBU2303857.1 histidinol-phosphate transaminase [Alphaproteobacteria bacterium]MBU2367196.1 histidinol-phosphate transaminase [Alphaproteobacteria bacterium]